MAKGQSELARRRRAQNSPVDYGKRTRSAYRILERLTKAWGLNDFRDIAKELHDIKVSAETHLKSFTYSENEK